MQRPSDTQNLDQAEEGGTTRFASYEHPNGYTNAESQATGTRESFWDSYFKRMGLVGPKITLGATGRTAPAGFFSPNPTGAAPMGIVKQGLLSENDLLGGYGKKDVEMTQAGQVFLDENGVVSNENLATLSEQMDLKDRPLYTNQTWGQMNSWNDPFEGAAGFPIVGNQGLRVALQLLEIWSMVVLRLLITTSLLQIASYLISVVTQGGLDGDGYKVANWNRNYYPEDPQALPGSAFYKGYSGFNHPSTDILSRGMEDVSRAVAATKDAGGAIAQGVAQLALPAVGAGAKIVEDDLLNLTVHIQRELNIYIPRHILSTMANETGYNGKGENIPENIGLKLFKALDIYTAYVRAYTAGMATMVVTVGAGDYGKSLGFWKTLFRTVVRSKSEWGTRKNAMNGYEGLLNFLGKDDKVMRFADYLARIGDIGTASGMAGNIAFPENKVPLDMMKDFPTLRTAGGRKYGHATKSKISLTETPSLYLIPKNGAEVRQKLEVYGVERVSDYASALHGENELWKTSDEIDENIGNKFQSSSGNRFTPDQVRMIEDQLEGEHMPFYIQDLRTNEIISFHAFLTSLSDAYSGDWSAQKGFGRLEAAQIYGGGSRSIGVSFMMVPMNQEDFNEMWYKINKLTTLVYPQWSEGTLMDSGDSTFIQPFSQVPTASPLCRLRVGDLFTSNYSKVSMARMMGIGNEKFKYTEPGGSPPEGKTPEAQAQSAADQRKKQIEAYSKNNRYISGPALRRALTENKYSASKVLEIMEKYSDNPFQFVAIYEENDPKVLLGQGPFATKISLYSQQTKHMQRARGLKNKFLQETMEIPEDKKGTLDLASTQVGLASLFRDKDGDDGINANPIFKSFHSTMGRGIAVAVTGITFDWKLGSAPWNLEPGARAPRMCQVDLSVIPIHDITPGLDHQGINRAPIYKVGSMSESLTGDAWYDKKTYQDLTSDIETRHKIYLRGEEKHLKDVPEDKK